MVSLLSLAPLAYVSCGLLPLLLLPYSRVYDAKPGSTGLSVALIGLSVWSIAYGLAIAAAGYATILILGSLVILGSQLATIGYLLLAIEYTDAFELTPRLFGGCAAFVVAVQGLSLTEPFHGLLWGETDRPIVDTTATEPLATAVVVVTLLIAGVAVLLLLTDAVTATGVRRKQSLALLAAGVPTIIITIVDVYVIEEYVYSILPFGVVTSAFVIAWALFRMDFLEIAPVGRKRIVEEMEDAAIVLDADDRVVECNPAARRLTGVGPDYAGMPIEALFSSVPDAVDRFRGEHGVDTEITVAPDGERRHFHLRISRLGGPRTPDSAGRLIVLRDITQLKRRERTLERRESELEFLRQILTRVLRHNIRNDLTVVRGYAEAISDDADSDIVEMATHIIETSDDLLETSAKARTIERVVNRDETVDTVDLVAVVDALAERYRSTYPRATLSLDAPDRCLVETDPRLESAFDVLLENALEHNDDPHPSVEIAIERATDRVTVTISDDGPGIPPEELAVLEQGEETPLEHGSGIGLWIVYWIVERSAATLTFDAGPDGTTVSIEIPT